ncbi:MAG: hypothetical protein JW915_23755 [Chitinispirillaceae bacterium]|nr:hypothetical protein [Chitinispirillaceae bacterium]
MKDKVENDGIEITIHDYEPKDVSYEISSGILLTNEINIASMHYVSFVDFSLAHGSDKNKLRVPQELNNVRTYSRPMELMVMGDKCTRWTSQFSIGFKPRDEVTWAKQLFNGPEYLLSSTCYL